MTPAVLSTVGNMAGHVVGRLIELVITFVVARYLGDHGFGQLSYAFAFVGVFSLAIDLGVNRTLLREMSAHPEESSTLLGNALALRLVLTAGATALAVLAALLLIQDASLRRVLLVGVLSLFTTFRFASFKDIFEVPLMAHLRMHLSALCGLLARAATAAGLLAAVALGASTVWIMAVYVIGAVPGVLLLAGLSLRLVRPAFGFDGAVVRRLLRASALLLAADACLVFMSQADLLILRAWQGDAAVGWLAAARRLTESAEFIPAAMATTVFPLLARGAGAEAGPVLARALAAAVGGALVLMVPVALAAGPIIRLCYGEQFGPAVAVLRIAAAGLPFAFANQVLGTALIARNRPGRWAGASAAGLVVLAAGCWWLIPVHGAAGAITARVAGAAAVCLAAGLALQGR